MKEKIKSDKSDSLNNNVIVDHLWVVHQTAKETHSDTNAPFKLIAHTFSGKRAIGFPDLPHDERRRGAWDMYSFDVRGMGIYNISTLEMQIETGDAWLPASLFVFGKDSAGGYHAMAIHPNWGFGWFDMGDDTVGKRKIRIT